VNLSDQSDRLVFRPEHTATAVDRNNPAMAANFLTVIVSAAKSSFISFFIYGFFLLAIEFPSSECPI
jgi:hypothetical protein